MAKNRSEVVRIAVLTTLVVVIALTFSAPDKIGFWVAMGVAAIGFGPYFSKGWRGFLWVRLVAVCIGAPLYFAFAASSPGHAAFWVILGAVSLVMLPVAGVSVHFLTDKR
jgi:hypothetical protein